MGTINELDTESRKMVLFKLKIEIGEYYEKDYLTYEGQMWKLCREINSNIAETNYSLNTSPRELFAYRNSPYEDRIMTENFLFVK